MATSRNYNVNQKHQSISGKSIKENVLAMRQQNQTQYVQDDKINQKQVNQFSMLRTMEDKQIDAGQILNQTKDANVLSNLPVSYLNQSTNRSMQQKYSHNYNGNSQNILSQSSSLGSQSQYKSRQPNTSPFNKVFNYNNNLLKSLDSSNNSARSKQNKNNFNELVKSHQEVKKSAYKQYNDQNQSKVQLINERRTDSKQNNYKTQNISRIPISQIKIKIDNQVKKSIGTNHPQKLKTVTKQTLIDIRKGDTTTFGRQKKSEEFNSLNISNNNCIQPSYLNEQNISSVTDNKNSFNKLASN